MIDCLNSIPQVTCIQVTLIHMWSCPDEFEIQVQVSENKCNYMALDMELGMELETKT